MKLLKPKSLFFKILSLCLLIFAGFLINSCRKDILNAGGSVVEKTLANHHVNIAQLQNAYVNGIKGNKQKTADISAQAVSNIISTLNVDWSTYTLQEFPDSSKIIEFPMPDDTTLIAPKDSIQTGNNKYKSKTSAVFILHKDTIILNFFMKTVENLNDPTYQSTLDQQFYLNTPANFNGEVMYFTLDRQFINGYLWKGGSIAKAITIGTETTTPTPQTQTYKGKLKMDLLALVNCTTDYYEVVSITTVTTPYGSTTTTEPTGITFSVTTCDIVDTGGGGSGSAPSGGVSGGGGTTPPPPPCSTGSSSGAAVASVKNGRLIVNIVAPPTGGTGGTPTTPSQPCPTTPAKPPTTTPQKATVDKLMKNPAALTPAQKAQVQAILDQILKDCIGQATYNYMTTHADQFDFQVSSSMSAQASYNPTTDMISMKNTGTLSAQGLEEELFHAYQNKTTSGGTAKYAGKAGAANIEFEAKVLRDMNAIVNGQGGALAVPGDEYGTFIKNVTSNYNSLPHSFTSSQLTEYFKLMGQFIQANPGYSTNQIDPTLNPSAMFSLINSSSCSVAN